MLLKFVSLILTLLTLSFGVVSYPPSSGGGGGGSTLTQGSATPGQLGTLTFGAATTAAPSYTTGLSYPFSLNLAGGLRVDGSGVTQPVSGTFWQATQPVSGTVASTQSGTWTVQPGNTANTTPWLVTGTGGTFPVTGTFWQATQPVSGTVTTTPPSNASTNIAQINAVTPLMGNGVTGTGSQRVTIASDNTAFTVNAAQSGTWTVQPGNTANTTAWLFAGGKTHNNAAPGATNLGSLGAVATAAAPSFTEGNMVGQSTNLLGDTRSISKVTDGTTTAGVIAGTTALKTDMSSVAGTATSTAAAGVQKVGIVGNANAAFDAANNATAPANVVVAGFEIQSGATATAGTAGQVRRGVAGLDGVLYARIGGPVTWSGFIEAVTVTTQVLAAPGAGLKAYVTSITCSDEAATAQSVDVVFGTGANCATGTTALTHKFQLGTNATTTSPFVIQHTFMSPLVPTAANAICVRPSAATAFGCTLTGYTAP